MRYVVREEIGKKSDEIANWYNDKASCLRVM